MKQAKELGGFPNTVKSFKNAFGIKENPKTTSTNGKAPHSHTWNLLGVREDIRHQKLRKFKHNFGINSIHSTSPLEFSFSSYTKKTGDVSIVESTGQIKLTTATAGYLYVKSALKLVSSSSYYEIDVKECTNAEIGIGLGYDETFYFLGRYNKSNETAYIKNPANASQAGTYIDIAAPFKLILHQTGTVAILAIQKDGVVHKLGEQYFHDVADTGFFVGSRFSFDVNLIDNTSTVTIGGIEAGITSGFSPVSDMGLVQYENCEPVIIDGYYYFTSSVHSANSIGGAGGINIFRFKKNTYDIEYVGHITGVVGARIICMNSGKLVYDRRNDYWYFQGTSFYYEPSLGSYITKTKENPLHGNSILEMTLMQIPVTAGQNSWDFSFTYNQTTDKCEVVFTKDPGAVIVKCETGAGANAVFDGIYSLVATSTAVGEGATIVCMNNTKYVIVTKDVGMNVLSFNDLTELGSIATNKWANKYGTSPSAWGFVLADQSNGKTKYKLFVHSGSDKWGGGGYGYGSMWVYEAVDSENGLQFDENGILKFA